MKTIVFLDEYFLIKPKNKPSSGRNMPLNIKFLKLFCPTKRDFSDLKKRDQKTFINRILKIGLLYIWSSEIWSKYVKLQNFWTSGYISFQRWPNLGLIFSFIKKSLMSLSNLSIQIFVVTIFMKDRILNPWITRKTWQKSIIFSF